MGRLGIWGRNRGLGKNSTRRHGNLSRAVGASFERLENRQLLSLLGISPGYPSIFYDTTGKLSYTYNNSTSQGTLTATATPRTYSVTSSGPTTTIANGILPRSLSLTLTLDSSGNIIPTAGPNLIIDGKFTDPSTHIVYNGILLEGDIEQFGYQYTGTTTDDFDFRLKLDPTNPGLLAPIYGSDDIGIAMLSASSTFTGSFATNFNGGFSGGGGVNGTVGPISPLPPALGSLAGYVYEDADNNGVYGGPDSPLPGVEVNLSGTDYQGNPVSETTTTGIDGSYMFSNLEPSGPNGYAIDEIQSTVPAPLLEGKDSIGTLGGNSAVQDEFSAIELSAGQNGVFYNFGEIPPGSISGVVYCDDNTNGVYDTGTDDTIGGAVLTLNGTNDLGNNVTLTTNSASDGSYDFGGLRPGTYTVSVTNSDSTHTLETAGSIGPASLAVGANTTGDDFGYVQLTPVSGQVVDDNTSTGIDGVNITLSGVDYLGEPVGPESTTTTGNGSFSFGSLLPGSYTITEGQVSGYFPDQNNTGTTTFTLAGCDNSAVVATFGEIPPASISGFKYDDLTGNGITSDDTGLAGVTINLFENGGATPVETTTTAADGSYSFTGLAPANYSVQEVVPAGWVQTAGIGGYSITAAAGSSSTGNNFADFQLISISGTKFTDITGNGFSSDDTGLAGVTINLFENGVTSPVASTTTASNGSYSFTNLGPGSYSVQEVVPTGWTQTGGVGGYSVTATSGSTVTGENFDDFQNISISGTKYNDLTDNGLTSDDTPLAGVTINLFENGGASPVASTTTASNGTYSFTNLGPGTYSVQEVVPTGWSQTAGIGGYTIAAKSGANSSGNNFADFLPISISGTKYTDLTGNGFSSDDTPLAGVTINLYKNGAASPFATTTTAANGTYSFTNLAAATYVVNEVVPTGWTQTAGVGGYTVVGTSGVNATGDNFDDFKNFSISGTKYKDLTGNGFSSDDTVLSGVTINLFKNGGSSPFATTTTSSAGTYAFTNLGPGSYSVQEIVPTGWTQTGGVGGYTITPTSGAAITADNFDDFQNISISGTKYDDLTDNGLTSDDTPLGGVTIDLFKNGSTTPFETTLTASNGTYSFTNLGPATYTVQELVPSGWLETYGMAGYSASPKCGTNITGDNFADFQLLTISGIKYQDLTGNGFSSDDTPLGGVTIQLYKDANKDGKLTSADGGPIATTVTAAGTGAYGFGNLLPGTYFVEEVVPSGWVQTGPATPAPYTINATATTKTYTGNNFDDYQETCAASMISYYYYEMNSSPTHYNVSVNNVHEGDQVTVYFDLTSPMTLSFVSYTAPSGSWVPAQAPQQVLFDQVTGTFGVGLHSLTVTVPMSYFQIDFVCGPVINVLGAAGSNVGYTAEGRMVQSDNGGTDAQFSGGGSLAGYVYSDANKDKLFDSGDLGIAGAIVTLTGKDSTGKSITLTRLTDANGYYYFKGLKAGTYTLTETVPSGYNAGITNVGTIGGKATGTASSTTVISNIALTLTSVGINYDFADLHK